ncbi:uncharacterized protein BDV14DRAFT_178310 [Aspergillus stella-maris]|uniref:uncharacterized protein n=1 Tax=Aspergillus stella-maris TaxID=1810926 RepID=UPI003CCDE689
MCQLMKAKFRHLCGHRTSQDRLMELDGCKNCGIVKRISHLGETRTRGPCDECINNRVWVNRSGKWERF